VFVVCFDSATIFIYDPEADRVEAEVITGRGPHPLTFDLDHGVAYVGHFTDSYIGAIALDQRFPRSYGSIIATIGTPSAPRATK
jgi:DNA-binding beta-propeller fold protein YncE